MGFSILWIFILNFISLQRRDFYAVHPHMTYWIYVYHLQRSYSTAASHMEAAGGLRLMLRLKAKNKQKEQQTSNILLSFREVFISSLPRVGCHLQRIYLKLSGGAGEATVRTRSNWKTNEILFVYAALFVNCEAFLRAIWWTQRNSDREAVSRNPVSKSKGRILEDKMNENCSLISKNNDSNPKMWKSSIWNEEFKRKAETTTTSQPPSPCP